MLEKLKAVVVIDVRLPTTDGLEVVAATTTPMAICELILRQMKWELPDQPPARITVPAPSLPSQCSEGLLVRSLR